MKGNNRHVNELLRAQAGVASLDQLQQLGLSRAAIEHRRKVGLDISVFPGVVRGASAPATWHADVVAAGLFLGNRAVASGRLAARLLGMSGFENDPGIEFSTPTRCRGVGGLIRVRQSRRLSAIDTMEVHLPPAESGNRVERVAGVPVLRKLTITTPTRTIIDLSRDQSLASLARLVDSSIALRLTSVDLLLERLVALRGSGVSGVRKLDEVLIDAGVESWLERRFLRLIREAGLPRPRCQVVFRDGFRTAARVDFLFDGTNVIVEVSGRRGHVTDAERRKDARRRNELQQAGFLVIEFTTADVVRDEAYVIGVIKTALQSSHA